MLAGFPSFPQARYTPPKAVGLWGAPGAKLYLQSLYCGSSFGSLLSIAVCWLPWERGWVPGWDADPLTWVGAAYHVAGCGSTGMRAGK